MKLVVDANILFSFFRENPVRFMILNASSFNLKLFSPAHGVNELRSNISDLMKYSKLSKEEILSMIEKLEKLIIVIPSLEYKNFKLKAQELSPHKSDKDTPYFALALKLNCPIWSNESALKKQSWVPIFTTEELVNLLSSS